MAFATDAQRRWFFAHLSTGMRRIAGKMRESAGVVSQAQRDAPQTPWGDPLNWKKSPKTALQVKPNAPVALVKEKAENMIKQQLGGKQIKWTRKLTSAKFPTGYVGFTGEAFVSAKGYPKTRMLVTADSDGSEMMIRPVGR